jgi:hypothetical protein
MQSTYRSVPAGTGTPTSVFSAVTVKLKEPPNRFASDLSDADLADLADTQTASADGEERGRDVRDGMLATPNEAHLAHLTQTPTVRRPRCGRAGGSKKISHHNTARVALASARAHTCQHTHAHSTAARQRHSPTSLTHAVR